MRNNRKFRVPTILIATRLFKLTVIAISKKAKRLAKTRRFIPGPCGKDLDKDILINRLFSYSLLVNFNYINTDIKIIGHGTRLDRNELAETRVG